MQIIPPSTGNSAIAPAPIRVTNDIGTTNFIGEIKETGYGSGTITTQVEYDKNGNITKYGDNTYVYDDLNRLVRENNLELGKSFLYGYDNRGNLCTKFEFVYSTDETLTNSLTSKAFIGGTWDDQLDYTCVPQTGEKTYFTYDNSGRTLTIGNSQSFTWNEDGSLNSSSYHSILGTTKTEYVYDNSGNRVALVNYAVDSNDDINSHKKHFRYLNGKLVYQVRETIMAGQHDPINFVYNTTGLIGFFYNHELYTYRKNLFGDITEIYKGSELVAKYIYDAWGNHKVCNPDDSENPNDNFIGNINPFRYRGYYYDIETGLYYLKSRYYSPKLGRFISPDSVEYLEPDNVNGLNLYAYCYNNPIMYVDNMGYYPEPIILFAEIISGFAESIGQLIWKQAENYLKNPITMKQAQKIIRKNGLKQSARSLLRAYSNDAFDSLKFGKTLNKFGSILSTGLLLLDIGNTIYNNYESKSDTWLSESIVDVGYTLIQTGIATFCTIYIPAIGWLIGIGANLFLDYIMEETNLIDNIKSWITQYDN